MCIRDSYDTADFKPRSPFPSIQNLSSPKLFERDYTKELIFVIKFELKSQEQNFHEQLIKSDRAHLHLSGHVSKQNMRYWSDSNPQELHAIPLYSQRVTVWY